jgi:hypothetical protein
VKDFMVEFRIHLPTGPGQVCLMRVSAMMCLFPEYRHIRTIEHGWTVQVCEEDWPRVEKAFRSEYLGNRMKLA